MSLTQDNKIRGALVLTSIIFGIKLGGGYVTNSLALQGDAWHLFTDLVALLITFVALSQAKRSADLNHTFGYFRYGIVAALINNVSLIMVSLWILSRSINRLFHPAQIHPQGMMLIALAGLIFNAIIAFNLRTSDNNLNIKSAFLHFLGDALADVGVILGALIIHITGFHGVDTLVSAILGCLILGGALKMTKETLFILLERSPQNINPEEVLNALTKLKHVKAVSDLHIWSLSGEHTALCALVCIDNVSIAESEQILISIQDMLKTNFSITHSTIQFETIPCRSCCHDKPVRKQLCVSSCPPERAG